HAMYRMRNARQRLSIQIPANAEFDSQPLIINNQNVAIERGDGQQLFIPLSGYDTSQSLVVELKYTIPGDHRQIDLPVFPDAPAAQTVYLGVFLPKERMLLASDGPWTEEFELKGNNTWKSVPVGTRSLREMISWVKEGTITVPASDNEIQSDGVLHLYSTSRPEDAPTGSLRLQVVDDRWWASVVVGSLLLVGLLLLWASMQFKLAAIALVASIAIATGVFAPTLASQLTNLPSYVGCGLVGILWGAKWLIGIVSSFETSKAEPIPIAPSTPESHPATTDAQTNLDGTSGSGDTHV
ncbi:MAG: hypothetical protein ABL921_08170, partial [Pirellula sp.]